MPDLKYAMFVRPIDESEGGGYLAMAMDLPGCVGDGETPADAIADLEKAIGEWTDEALRIGAKIPVPGEAIAKASQEIRNLRDLVNTQQEVISSQRSALAEQEKAMATLGRLEEKLEKLKEDVDEILHEHGHDTEMSWLAAPVGAVFVKRKTQLIY